MSNICPKHGYLLTYNEEHRYLYCSRCRKEQRKNPFIEMQKDCLPIAKFLEKYPFVINRRRFKIFQAMGMDCITCGLKGTLMVWWQQPAEKFGDAVTNHYDFAGRNIHGKLIMMTIDHIIPHSKGGPDHISNYQPMCAPCNGKKKDNLPV